MNLYHDERKSNFCTRYSQDRFLDLKKWIKIASEVLTISEEMFNLPE